MTYETDRKKVKISKENKKFVKDFIDNYSLSTGTKERPVALYAINVRIFLEKNKRQEIQTLADYRIASGFFRRTVFYLPLLIIASEKGFDYLTSTERIQVNNFIFDYNNFYRKVINNNFK